MKISSSLFPTIILLLGLTCCNQPTPPATPFPSTTTSTENTEPLNSSPSPSPNQPSPNETSNEEINEALINAESPIEDFAEEAAEPPLPSTTTTEPKTNSTERHKLNKILDFNQALQAAQSNGKPILLDFTGSDWCPPCIRMEREVFSTPTFAEFANQNLNFVYVDFPRRKKIDPAQVQHNSALAEKFNIQGYPTLILLDKNGKELSRIEEYLPGGPKRIIDWIQKTTSQ